MRELSSVCLLVLGIYVFGWSVALFLARWSRRRRARHIYRIRHERLLREHEGDLHDAASNSVSVSTWTQDDIAQLASLTVARKLESSRRHVREVKQARRATKQLKARLAKGDTK